MSSGPVSSGPVSSGPMGSGPMSSGQVGTVRTSSPDTWHGDVAAALAEGFGWLHGLDAVDNLGRRDTITITCRLLRFGAGEQPANAPEACELVCEVPRDGGELPTVTDLLAGAEWYEREVHDFFGVHFAGGSDLPLLNHDPSIRPLRKDFVLATRAATPWPGGREPGESRQAGAPSRRRLAPPGVPDPQVWGARDLSDPAPDAEELAASLAGGRVRRRR